MSTPNFQPSQAIANKLLAVAASENLVDVARHALEKGANPNYEDDHGYTPAMYFADHGNVAGIAMIHSFMKDANDAAAAQGHLQSNAINDILKMKVVGGKKVSPALLIALRGDVDGLLVLGALDRQVLEQPVLTCLMHPDPHAHARSGETKSRLTKADIVNLLQAGFALDAQFEAAMANLGFSTEDVLEMLDQAVS